MGDLVLPGDVMEFLLGLGVFGVRVWCLRVS